MIRMMRVRRAFRIVGARLTYGIGSHCYRSYDGPCLFTDCGRPGVDHWEFVGEWMLSRREQWSVIGRRALIRLRNRP